MLGAALALAGNVVACINGANTIAAERESTRSALLVESLRTGDPDQSLKMLQLLDWLALVEVPGDVMQRYRSDPATTPFLPVARSEQEYRSRRNAVQMRLPGLDWYGNLAISCR